MCDRFRTDTHEITDDTAPLDWRGVQNRIACLFAVNSQGQTAGVRMFPNGHLPHVRANRLLGDAPSATVA